MKFPESWLREHVSVAASRDELAATLTAIGLEVEGIEPIGAALVEYLARMDCSSNGSVLVISTGVPASAPSIVFFDSAGDVLMPVRFPPVSVGFFTGVSPPPAARPAP